jgi:hypothetical protein
VTVLIPETGTGVTGANSYCDVAFADDYFAGHPFYFEAWDDLGSDRKNSLLIFATSLLDSMTVWYGTPVFQIQSLKWPRYGILSYDGLYLSQNTIPRELKQAVCEMAVYLANPLNNIENTPESTGVSELKIDVIQLKFTTPVRALAAPLAVMRLLRGLGGVQNSSRVRKVRVEV